MPMKRKKDAGTPEINTGRHLKRYAALILVFYVLLTAGFYFLAGDQLHLRQSRGNLELPVAEAGTVELCVGSVVELRFTNTVP